MLDVYRLGEKDAHLGNPHRPPSTSRPPGNVPYIVDNLWEWKRPAKMPTRRRSVFASPRPELARKYGGSTDGQIFRIRSWETMMAQIKIPDASEHPDVKNLRRLVLSLLDESIGADHHWASLHAVQKLPIALLWVPCLEKHELEQLFAVPPLSVIGPKIWEHIRFWDDACRVDEGQDPPDPEGEIFFECESYELFPA